MNGYISVIYEKGVLRPLTPLNLPENTNLEIQIVSRSPNKSKGAELAYQVLLQAGLIQPSEGILGEQVSEKDRQKAAAAYGNIGPLSELIIAERDDQ